MNYIDITSPDINNGLGCRATVWIAGCPHQCPGCHNPETWDYHVGKPFYAVDIFNELKPILDKDYIQGITFSGGDPIAGKTKSDLEHLLTVIKSIKTGYPTKDIWIYSGNIYENLIKNPLVKEILNNCDVLIDGPYIQSKRDIRLPFRGSSNQRIIDLKKTTSKKIVTLPIE